MRKFDDKQIYDAVKLILDREYRKYIRHRFFRGTVTNVVSTGPPITVQIRRNGETQADGNTYVVGVAGYKPQIGDDVDMVWRDEVGAYVMMPLGGPGAKLAGGWIHWSRYVVGPGGNIDTSSNPGGDIPLPPGYNHAMVIWRAQDTSVQTVASFGGLQIAVQGGAIDAGNNYNWSDEDSQGNPVSDLASNGGINQAAFDAIVTTGGGTGANWWSKGTITLPFYADPIAPTAHWQLSQINASNPIQHIGAGYYNGTGPVTKLHFFSGINNLAAGTTFDLLVMA